MGSFNSIDGAGSAQTPIVNTPVAEQAAKPSAGQATQPMRRGETVGDAGIASTTPSKEAIEKGLKSATKASVEAMIKTYEGQSPARIAAAAQVFLQAITKTEAEAQDGRTALGTGLIGGGASFVWALFTGDFGVVAMGAAAGAAVGLAAEFMEARERTKRGELSSMEILEVAFGAFRSAVIGAKGSPEAKIEALKALLVAHATATPFFGNAESGDYYKRLATERATTSIEDAKNALSQV